MFKFIGIVAVVAAAGLGIAHFRGVLDLDFGAKITPKGEQEMQEIRNSAADAIRGAADKAAAGVAQPQP